MSEVDTRTQQGAEGKSRTPRLVAAPAELAAAREARGMSQFDVSQRIKLQVRQVAALEEGNWDLLPGRAFARGALRSYGKLIQVDVTPLLEVIGTTDSTAQMPRHALSSGVGPATDSVYERQGRSGTLLWVIGGLVAAGALIYHFGSGPGGMFNRGGDAASIGSSAGPVTTSVATGDVAPPPGTVVQSGAGPAGAGSAAGGAASAGAASTSTSIAGSGSGSGGGIGGSSIAQPSGQASTGSLPGGSAAASTGAPAPAPAGGPGTVSGTAAAANAGGSSGPGIGAAATAGPVLGPDLTTPAPTATGSQSAASASTAKVAAGTPASSSGVAASPSGTSPASAAATSATAAAKPGTIALQSVEDSWVRVIDSTGKKVHEALIPAGTTVTVEGKPPYKLRMGNARHLKIHYAGKDVKLPPPNEKNITVLELP